MKALNHRLKKHSIGLYDSVTGKTCKTIKAVDVTDAVNVNKGEDPLILLYTKDRNGEIVQFRHGRSRLHYHTESIAKEEHRESALAHTAIWVGATKGKLIELALKHSPTFGE